MNKTVFVIGAGAGYDYNLPLGDDLKKVISEKLRIKTNNWGDIEGYRDDDIGRIVRHHYLKDQLSDYDQSMVIQQCKKISNALPLAKSIDNFVHSHRENTYIERLSKIAICKSILDAEKDSKMFVKKNENLSFNRLEGTWLIEFFKLLNTGADFRDLKKNLQKICLIIFNYDRCIESFLFQSIKTFYPLNDFETAEILAELEIYHPYGKVGDLEWEKGVNVVGFGECPDISGLIKISKEIKTFTQGVQESSLESIRQRVRNSEKVIFLGYGFHEINMELLYGKDGFFANDNMEYYGTAYKESQDSVDNVVKLLAKSSSVGIKSHIKIRNDLDCFNLFKEYSRTLKI